jgi:hypothetical protein
MRSNAGWQAVLVMEICGRRLFYYHSDLIAKDMSS